jgi:hypothetical protein
VSLLLTSKTLNIKLVSASTIGVSIVVSVFTVLSLSLLPYEGVNCLMLSTGMAVLSTGSRDGAHYLGRGTQGEPVETNLVCLVTNPDTDGFGQAQSQLSIQKHDVTVSGLDRCHAKEHGNYDECAHGAVYNTMENSETDHDGAWQIVGPNGK